MGIQLTGEGAFKGQTLRDLFTEIARLDAEAGQSPDREFFPIVPPNPELDEETRESIKTAIREKIIELLRGSVMIKGNGDRPLYFRENYDVTPGEGSRFFDAQDLAVMEEDVRLAMDPKDPDFLKALSDRSAGVLKLLGMTINFIGDHKDPRAAFKHFQRVATGGTAMPWQKEDDDDPAETGPYRKDAYLARMEVMTTKDLGLKNAALMEELKEGLFRPVLGTWRLLVAAYEAATLDMEGMSELERTRYFYVLLSNLKAQAKRMTQQLNGAAKELGSRIRHADTKDQVAFEIDNFVLKTLPGIAALEQQAQAGTPKEPTATAKA
jgi:hypothetical protein